ncbi:hypothetical protein, variant [Exophiala oligosperma]|uniref:Uncharacterized protein n=2 Tax=Chaetothyriales TaxID=34395 RepID=A0A0D2DGC3_9EURO|nr:uncharacterized protein PV06_07012 [Exophiala oligosperma]XP_016261671.1 hypothetical protein, variant [Exophiala oligosperma]KAJ9640746.1 hypothetical protein H2204_003035 [Knufia peltigerae]KIW41454.1 hypothetical protein PV06_07012 [Exophiala oligosperma]KIW41455.1 hypothetical protein, variant [Exophiala oligosperma]
MKITTPTILFALALTAAALPAPDDTVGAEASPASSTYAAAYTPSTYTDTDVNANADNDTDTAVASASAGANATSTMSLPTASASASAPPPSSYDDMFNNRVIVVDDATFLRALEYAAVHPTVIGDDNDNGNDSGSPNEKRDNALQPKAGKLPKNKKPEMVRWCTPQMDYCTTWYAPYGYYGNGNGNGKRDVERRARNDWPDSVRVWCSKHDGPCVPMGEREF